jgi:hypothetical protein
VLGCAASPARGTTALSLTVPLPLSLTVVPASRGFAVDASRPLGFVSSVVSSSSLTTSVPSSSPSPWSSPFVGRSEGALGVLQPLANALTHNKTKSELPRAPRVRKKGIVYLSHFGQKRAARARREFFRDEELPTAGVANARATRQRLANTQIENAATSPFALGDASHNVVANRKTSLAYDAIFRE